MGAASEAEAASAGHAVAGEGPAFWEAVAKAGPAVAKAGAAVVLGGASQVAMVAGLVRAAVGGAVGAGVVMAEIGMAAVVVGRLAAVACTILSLLWLAACQF